MVSASVVCCPDQSRFTVNGVEVLVDKDLGKNLNSVIKAETNFKVAALPVSAVATVFASSSRIGPNTFVGAGHKDSLRGRGLRCLRCRGVQIRRHHRYFAAGRQTPLWL